MTDPTAGMTPARRALHFMRTHPELLESCARNLRGSLLSRVPARRRDTREWQALEETERRMWQLRALRLQAELAARTPFEPDDPDGDGEPMIELAA